MSDDRLFDSFHMLDGPVDPDEAFTERLFQGLAADLGFRPVTQREAVVRRFAGAAPTFRLAYLAAMLGLLLAAAVVVALVGAQLLQARYVAEIVSASQAAQLNPPAYDMTIQADDGRIVRVRTDGQGAWRWNRKADGESPGDSYEVSSNGQSGTYEQANNTWSVSPSSGNVPNPSLFGWGVGTTDTDPVQGPELFSCPDWTRLADDIVAGRPAYHLACDAREFWVDQESSLLVRMHTPSGQELAGVSGRATALALEPSFPPDTFALTAPAGAVTVDPNQPRVSTVLEVGRAAPALSGTTIDGTPFDTSAQDGPLVMYFWATWCEPCLDPMLRSVQAVAARHSSSVTTIAVATQDNLDAVNRYLSANDLQLPVVNDPGSMAEAWGLNAFPTLVMLDENGAASAIDAGPLSESELERMYAALEAGGRVPPPVATPSASAEGSPATE